MSWEMVRFGDLYAVESRNGLTKPSRIRGSGYKMINMGELFANDRLYDIPMELVPLTEREKRNALVEKNDLLFARQSLVLDGAGKCIIVMEVSELTVFESHLIRVRLNKERAVPMFYYYYLRSPLSPIKTIVSQCAQAGIRGSDLQELPVLYPSINVQRHIAAILSSYDNLIENNQKQIKLLEETARRLYKEWFIDLRFPGHETTPVVDGVPEGWRKYYLKEIIDYEIGGGWGEEFPTDKCNCAAYVIRGTDLSDITHGNALGIPFRYHAEGNLQARALVDGDIIFEVSGGSKTEGVARTALVRRALIKLWGKPVICASFCKLIRLIDTKYSQFVFDTLQYMRRSGKTTEYDKRSASSIVNYRWRDFLNKETVVLPSEEVLKRYNFIAENVYQMVLNKSVAIEKAREARDRLLPKLMNGEIEV